MKTKSGNKSMTIILERQKYNRQFAAYSNEHVRGRNSGTKLQNIWRKQSSHTKKIICCISESIFFRQCEVIVAGSFYRCLLRFMPSRPQGA
jgi:hypothetical protein